MKLILLPGLDGTGHLFEWVLDFLSPTVKVEIWPLPQEGDQSPCVLAELLQNRLDAEEEEVVILAESFSGRIAFELAVFGAAKVRGLILVASFLRSPRFLLSFLSLLPRKLVPWSWSPGWALRFFCLGWQSPAEKVRRAQELIGQVPKILIAERLAALSALKSPKHQLRIPCLYIRAQGDRLIPESEIVHVQNSIPGTQVQGIPGPHFLLQSRPRESAQLINQFLDLFLRPAS